MTKKHIKVFAVLLTIVLLITGIVALLNRNKVLGYNSTVYIGTTPHDFGYTSKYYCLNKGLDYSPGNYVVVGGGSLNDIVAYAIGYERYERGAGKTDPWNDAVANIVWEYMGSNSTMAVLKGDEYNDIINKANLIQNLNNDSIKISSSEQYIVENSQAEYGPFQIVYPQLNGTFVGDELKIIVNGTTVLKLEDLIKKEDGYYLTESQGIKPGEENSIKLEYKATKYTGTYVEYSRERIIARRYQCPVCGEIGIYQSLGIYYNGRVEKNSNANWTGSIVHSVDPSQPVYDEDTGLLIGYKRCTYSDDANDLKTVGSAYPLETNYQDIIEPTVNKVTIPLNADILFWAGKPNININLNKVNPKNEVISEVEFDVTVEGGTIDTANGATNGTMNGNSSFTIIPTKGTNTVKVTLEEISVPDDYVKFTKPIIIEYNWNGTEWVKNITQLPAGVTEGKSILIEKTETNRNSADCSDTFKITIVNRPVIKITLDKKDPQGNTVDVDFNIQVTGGTAKQEKIKDGETVIIEPAEEADKVKVVLTENDPGEEFVKYEDPIEMNFSFDETGWKLEEVSKPEEPEKVEIEIEENNVTVKAVNRRKIIVNLHKTDNASSPNPLAGMTFDVKVSGGTCEETTVTTDNDGYAKIVIMPNGTEEVTLELTEHDDKYYINPGKITIKFVYQGGYWQTEITTANNNNVGNISIDGNEAEFDLNIENIGKIDNLILKKLNKHFKDEAIAGVTFQIELINAETISGGKQLITAQTDGNGNIELEELKVLDPSDEIKIILKETGSPTTTTGLNYKGLSGGTITITLTHKQQGSCNVSVTGADSDLVEADYDSTKNIIEIQVLNEVTMSLSGRVWEDGQTGLKPVKSANGLQDSGENGIPNIKVSAIRASGSSSTGTSDVVETTVTDSNGNYEFKDLPTSASTNSNINYYIEFTYDGVNYIVTTPNAGDDKKDSDVSEDPNVRTDFNNKFHTITKDKATGTTLEYNYDATGAKLITTNSDGSLQEEKFGMKANTLQTTYSKNTENVDMGLIKKGVNLEAVTDIYSATVTINGVSKTYNYNNLATIEPDADGNINLKPFEAENVQYSLYLYNSDYNYRISNYQLPVAKKENLAVYSNGETDTTLFNAVYNQRKNDDDLNVEVTYQVLLNNKSATDATINEIAYYYDERYDLVGIKSTDANATYTDSGNEIRISTTQVFNDSNNQNILELTFKVKKNADELQLGTMQNWVEITSYSTNSGCIDSNSAPDNMKQNRAEDDTDDAPGLVVQLNHLQREISGFVFEDVKGTNASDGLYNGNDKKIDDVIVQLIEIKDVEVDTNNDGVNDKTLRLEYIWQETVSGSKTVRYIPANGYIEDKDGNGKIDANEFPTYDVTNEDGHYTFNQNIIAGNYIVRFVYGDDEYWDTAKNSQNILKYNGQDYKSTIDEFYNKDFKSSEYEDKQSMARDNEARRLEQIGDAIETSKSDIQQLTIDERSKLDKTWMCAETSKIEMKISQNGTSEGDSKEKTGPLKENANFGLVKRTSGNLLLEKHITSVYIEGIGTTYANLDSYDNAINNNLIVELQDNPIGLKASATNKDKNERGKWLLETQTSTIEGNKLKITYTYRISNVGDFNSYGAKLNTALTTQNLSYKDIASLVKIYTYDINKKNEDKYKIGDYLGTAYYCGVRASDEVSEKIQFKVEDYMGTNNALEVVESESFIKLANSENRPVWKYKSSSSDEKVAEPSTEDVYVIQTKDILELNTNTPTILLTLEVTDESINAANGSEGLVYRSYAAQLIYPTTDGSKISTTGIVYEGLTFGNLGAVQSYVDVAPERGGIPLTKLETSPDAFAPELDEFVGETLEITIDFGADKRTPVILIVTITSGLAVIAVGIVLIKKFIIK